MQRLLDIAARNTKKRYLAAGIKDDISWYGIDEKSINYANLLTILMDNGLAAVDTEGVVNLVPLMEIRQQAVPVIKPADLDAPVLPSDEVVSVVLRVKHVEAAKLIPLLRPLMPQWAQLAVVDGEFLVTDRYANIRRIAFIMNALDQEAQAGAGK